MKTLLSTLSLFLISLSLTAQITYSASDFANAGDEFYISKSGSGLLGLSIPTAGDSMVWDFTALTAQEQDLRAFYPNTESSYKIAWCGLNFYIFTCSQEFDELTNMIDKSNQTVNVGDYNFQNVQNHYKKDDSAFVATMYGFSPGMGSLNIPVPAEYTSYDTLIHFPLYMGRKDSSYSELNIDGNSVGINLSKKTITIRESEVDAWGVLKTPLQTYENTIRLKTNITTIDSLNLDSVLIPITRHSVEYLWFDTAFAYPVFKASGNVFLGIPAITSVEYMDTMQCFPPNASFAFWPMLPTLDSATHKATINTYNWSSNADTYKWYVNDELVSEEETPNLDFYCPENYHLSLLASNTCNDTVIDTLTLAVAVLNPFSGFPVDTLKYEKCPSDSVLIFDSYYPNAGDYSYYTESSLGCDSLIILSVLDKAIDLEIQQLDDSLFVAQEEATYQWFDCETEENIEGAEQAYFIPEKEGKYAVKINYDDCEEWSDCYEFTFSSINKHRQEKSNISCYPNPVNDILYIQATESLKNIQIYNLSGTLLLEATNTNTIKVSNLLKGIYLVKISTSNGVYTRKIAVGI